MLIINNKILYMSEYWTWFRLGRQCRSPDSPTLYDGEHVRFTISLSCIALSNCAAPAGGSLIIWFTWSRLTFTEKATKLLPTATSIVGHYGRKYIVGARFLKMCSKNVFTVTF